MEYLNQFSTTSTLLIFFSAFIIGLTKSGLKGIDLLTVTITAFIFGGKTSTGVILPLLIFGDIMAVIYYRRHCQWPLFWKLSSWIALGILIGVYVGKDIGDFIFKKMFAAIILINIALMFWFEAKAHDYKPKSILFGPVMGLCVGFTSMIGNLAGGFANVYFMAQKINKNDFIGTAAWVFLIINLFKLPFQIFTWGNITLQSFKLNLLLFPIEFIGFILGVYFVKKINDNHYRKLIIGLTVIGALTLFIK